MQMTKKVLSVVLAVMMVVSMMVVGTVFSASAATITVTTAAEFDAAIQTSGEVVLGANINMADVSKSYATVPTGADVTIDFADYTLTAYYGIENDGTLTLKASGTGGINATGMAIDNFGKLTVESGTYTSSHKSYATIHSEDVCTTLVKGGTFTNDKGYGVYIYKNSNTTINGGTFTAEGWVVCSWAQTTGAKVTITNGTFTSTGNAVLSGNGTAGAGGNTWTIKGGTFNANADIADTEGYLSCAIYAPNDDTWTISGGTFNVKDGVAVCQRAGTVKITGGTFNVTGDGTTGKVGDSRVVVPSGSAVVYDSASNYPAQSDEDNTKISGGSFTTDQTPVAQVKNDGDATRITTSGGTFDQEVAAEFIDPVYEYDDATDKIVAKDDLTPVWDWIDSTSVSYRYQAQLTLKDGDTVVSTTVYSPTIAANADGSFTYSCTAKKVAGISYGPIANKEVAANFVIMTSSELSAAVKIAGEWKLGADLNTTTNVVSNGFKLDGQGHTLTTSGSLLPAYSMFRSKDANTKFELSNITLDGNNGRYGAVEAYTSNGGNNPNNEITLNNVTIKNFNNKSDYTGPVYAFGASTVNLNNCTITDNKVKTTNVKVNGKAVSDADAAANSGKSVWAGAKATVNINGGTYEEILLHGGTANTTIDGNATVDTVRFGFTNATEDSTKMKAVVNEATVNEVVSYTDFVEENVVKDPAKANVAAPAGYMWDDSATDGMKTLVSENPINKAMAKADDGNKFGLTCNYKKGAILGVQLKSKAEVDAPVTSESGQETGKDVRFIAVLDTNILRDATDYGFVLAKVDKDTNRKYSNTNFENLKANFGNGEKTISARDTFNNVCGDPAYGDPRLDTAYKYITCAVNGVADNEYVVARFYVTIGGKTYYGKYAGHNYHFTGCMTDANATAIAG